MKNICFSDISVVVQGAVNDNTNRTTNSIRRFLPGAYIILSTWAGSNVAGIDYDELVMSDDPGAFPCDMVEDSIMNNVNRQIVSTKAGLMRCKTKYAVKMRTDFFLTGRNFLEYFQKYNDYNEDYKFVKDRIVACSIYSRNPRSEIKKLCMPYCVSDFFYFGNTLDLIEVFSCNLVEDIEEKMYFELHPEERKKLHYKQALCRFMPEQTIWMGFIGKHINDLECSSRDDLNESNIMLTEKTIANNVVLCDHNNLSIDTFSHTLFTKGIPENCFQESDWIEIYEYYCLQGKVKKFKKYIKKVKKRRAGNLSVKHKDRSCKAKQSVNALDEVVRYIDKYKVVSFDVFDTLVFRRIAPDWHVAAQTGVFASMLLGSNGYTISEQDFNGLRDYFADLSGKKSLKNGASKEYLLSSVISDVLDYLGIDGDQNRSFSKAIYENEEKRELAVTYPNEDALALLKILKNKGKTVIAVSDMYLEKNTIVKILDKCGLISYIDYVYVSSEKKLLKSDGKLFNYILSDLMINASDLIHVGDNLGSDIEGASKENIEAILYSDDKNIERKKDIEKQVLSMSKMAFIEAALKKDRVIADDFESYISKYFSFDFINYAYDLAQKAYKRNIQAIYFLERDGSIFEPIFNELVNSTIMFNGLRKMQTYTIKLSRKDTACLVNIENVESIIKRAQKVNPPNRTHIIHTLGCFGLSIDDFDDLVQKEIVNHNSDFLWFCKHYRKLFYPLIKERQELIISRLNDSKFFDFKNIAIVDVGWGGTSQKDIQCYIDHNSLDTSVFGFYYACDDRALELIPNYSQYNYAPDLFYGYSLIEFLIKNYKADSIENMQDTYKYNQLSRMQILRDVAKFVEVVNTNSLTPAMMRQYSYPMVKSIIDKPDRDFCDAIKNVKFSLDRKNGDTYIPLFESVQSISKLNQQYQNAQWVQASLKVSSEEFLAYLRRRDIYDKLRVKIKCPQIIKTPLLAIIRYHRSLSNFE